jgi:hypothetical protein
LKKLQKSSVNSSKISSPRKQKSSLSRLEASGRVSVKIPSPNSKRAQSAESQKITKVADYEILVDVSKIKEELSDDTPSGANAKA